MALRGIRVVEMAGLAPAPFCGMILADFGASVVRVDRNTGNTMSTDRLARGKKSIAVNLKDSKGQEVVRKLAAKADVLIEPFRPGVMEKLNLGPKQLMSENPGLIYARLSGYGQTGPYVKKAGHDINYVAMSGMLSRLGRKDENPIPPINLLADFAGGGLTCALGILISLFERNKSGQGQIVDTSMVEGAAYVSSFIFKSQDLPIWGNPRGQNWLDTGAHFYESYKTKDDKYMAVGSIEPQFYEELLKGLDLDIEQFSDFEKAKKVLKERFSSKSQSEWVQIFENLDACVTPILEMEEAALHPLNQSRNSFLHNPTTGRWEPSPAPKLSRTPGLVQGDQLKDPSIGEHTVEIMKEIGYSTADIEDLLSESIVAGTDFNSKL